MKAEGVPPAAPECPRCSAACARCKRRQPGRDRHCQLTSFAAPTGTPALEAAKRPLQAVAGRTLAPPALARPALDAAVEKQILPGAVGAALAGRFKEQIARLATEFKLLLTAISARLGAASVWPRRHCPERVRRASSSRAHSGWSRKRGFPHSRSMHNAIAMKMREPQASRADAGASLAPV